ncbi:hypothetical protein GS399_20520 [Pedobacter sp. HMF7647]|uniref:Uncharacterized protein n=1 Tax=Hufsiella arboris TaxID=2695275 RepID=A0A7K1YFY3_9SPHI|nr:hypothetical protein [Hufsiella arboris]MXV53351.1 hypothetical protein [Hufsiella arboris]
MKKALPTILIGFIAITLFDVLGSITSRQMNFSYSYLGPISFLIYIATAFVIARRTDKKIAIISTALLGLYDATVGWKLSIFLQANTGYQKIEFTKFVFLATVIFVTLYGAILGFLGWWLSSKISRTKY